MSSRIASLRRFVVGTSIFLAVATSGASFAPAVPDAGQAAGSAGDVAPAVYLPWVWSGSQPELAPVWVSGAATQPRLPPKPTHEIALFRCAVPGDRGPSELRVFADTRYEAFLDGDPLGRGPARFSQIRAEYDTYRLEPSEVDRLLAVLVQWAPNVRRSESSRPHLSAGLAASSGVRRLACRGIRSDAWAVASLPVHSWHLIGPTELVDLRKLPADWAEPGFDDTAWPSSQPVNTPSRRLEQRSIPPLEHLAVPITVTDRGTLADGAAMLELEPGIAHRFSLPHPAPVTIEALASDDVVSLDGQPLALEPVGDARPDVVAATAFLEQGNHSVRAAATATERRLVALFHPQAVLAAPGPQPGPRLLLARTGSDPAAVAVDASPTAQRNAAIKQDEADSTVLTEIDVEFSQPGYLVLDLGRTVHGRVEARAEGPRGAVVDIGWAERMWHGRPLPHPGSLLPEWSQADSWTLDGTERRLTTLDARAGRYVVVAAWAAGTRMLSLRVVEEAFPWPRQGRFASGDPTLDRVWSVGADTLRSNMTDAYADPWRERGQWWGDAYVAVRVNRVVAGDATLWRRGLVAMADAFESVDAPAMAPSTHPDVNLLDYAMLWVISLNEYVTLTGDTSVLRQVYHRVPSAIGYFESYAAESGLLSFGAGGWYQKALIDWAGQFDREGEITALNALHAGGLDAAADLGDAVGDQRAAVAWRQRASAVRSAINVRLESSSGLGYTTARIGEQRLPDWPHAQAWPLVYGVVPHERREVVLDELERLTLADPSDPQVEIYGMNWVLEALGEGDRHAAALTLIRRHYGRMLESGLGSWPEVFKWRDRLSWSVSHAWGASPTWYLTTHLLGARQVGARTWQVRPAFEGIESASGALPLIGGGDLEVEWSGGLCGERLVTVAVPEGTAGNLVLREVGSGVEVSVNAAPAFGRYDAARREFVVPLEPGEHAVRLVADCPTER